MHCIQNSYISAPTPFNKAIIGFTSVLAITVIALSIIGLASTSSGPFNAIVQLGATTNGILLGTSIFVLILDLVWILALRKKMKEPVALAPAIEKINDTDSISLLPEEIILRAFGFLSGIELASCSEVSRRWRRLASDPILWNSLDLRKISPLIKVFDESDWITHVDLSSFGLDVTDAPPLDKGTAIPILKKCLSSLPIEGNAGVTLLTIPKGLTFKKLVNLAGTPKVGNMTQFRYIWEPFLNVLGDIAVDHTYRIVIANNVIKESRRLSIGNQEALLSKIGCKIPKVLEITVLLVLTFMISGERLYSDFTETRCSDIVLGASLNVGGFSVDGVYVNSYERIDSDYYGVAAVCYASSRA